MKHMNINKNFVETVDVSDVINKPEDEFRKMVHDNKVLVIRQPEFDIETFSSIVTCLGRPVAHPLENFSLPGYRNIIKISNLYLDGKAVGVHEGGSYWHTDMSYQARNTVFTALCAEKVPLDTSSGGTEFIDCEVAYDLLCRAINEKYIDGIDDLDIDSLYLLHCFGNREIKTNKRAAVQKLSAKQKNGLDDEVCFPLVFKHPVTKLRSIYAVAATSVRIKGWSPSESISVLDKLLDYILDNSPRYMHHYQEGDLVVWDNLSTMHRGQKIDRSDNETDCRLLYRMNVDYA